MVRCAYSVRATPGARVSAPLREGELTARLRHSTFSMKSMPPRVARYGDVWGDSLVARTTRQALAKALEALETDMPEAEEAPRRQNRSRKGR